MPSMAAITVKKADETTNIVYDALTPAAGDSSNAVWRQDTGAVAGLPVGMRALQTMRTMNNGPRTARRGELVYHYPYATQDSTTTRYSSSDRVEIKITVTLPNAIPANVQAEAVHQGLNLAASTLIKSCLDAGFAPA